MKRTSFATMPCPLARALDNFSDPWNGLVIREAFYGKTRYDDFKNALGIPTNTLSRVLRDLVEAGLLTRRVYSEKPTRYEYLLTPAGSELRPVLLTLLAWGNKHRPSENATVELVDTSTGKPVSLGLIDMATGKTIGDVHQVVRNTADAPRSPAPAPSEAQHKEVA